LSCECASDIRALVAIQLRIVGTRDAIHIGDAFFLNCARATLNQRLPIARQASWKCGPHDRSKSNLVGQGVAIQFIVEAQIWAVAPGAKAAVLAVGILAIQKVEAADGFEQRLIGAPQCGFENRSCPHGEACAFVVCASFPRAPCAEDAILHVDLVGAEEFIEHDGETGCTQGHNNDPGQQRPQRKS
jgi:hypothetical protein